MQHNYVNTSVLKYAAALLLALGLSACAGDKKDPKEPVSSGGGGGGGGDKNEKKDDSEAHVSARRVTLTNSLSNNPLTSQTINDAKAEALLGRLENTKNKATLEGRISAERLAKKGAGPVMAAAKKLADLEMDKGADRQISDDVKLDIALAAIGSRNFSLANHFLEDLTDSKDARVRAGANNAIGVIALKDDRVPEAVAYFKAALKAVPNYKPALLNLGFAALKGGDLNGAKRSLGDHLNDWFVKYGLITVARMEGNEQRADQLCDEVLKKESGHKAALFNCGLLEYQNKHNFKKAIELVNKAGKARGGEQGWDERIQMTETKIDQEEAKAKAADAKKKAAEKAAAPKPNGNGGAAKPN